MGLVVLQLWVWWLLAVVKEVARLLQKERVMNKLMNSVWLDVINKIWDIG